MTRRLALTTALVLIISACSDSSADTTFTTTTRPTTTTTSTAPTTTTTSAPTTTTTQAETTTTTSSTTTTTEPEDTTTTTGGEGDTTTTSEGETPPSTIAPPTTSSTTIPEDLIDPTLVEWAGVYRQPTGYDGYMQLRADGVVRAGFDFVTMPFEGSWDWEPGTDSIIFTGFNVAGDCSGASGRYSRDTAAGGGLTLTVIEDPCTARVGFMTQPGSACNCFTWLKVTE